MINTKETKNLTKWCHLYIRLRDLIRVKFALYGGCISCGKIWEVELFSDGSIMNGKKWHAGHYFLSDRNASVRFDEENIHLQCYYCNKSLSGNLAMYKQNLIKKIGIKRFESLEQRRNQIKKFNPFEIEELTEYYKQKAKIEAKRLGIKI
jgi:hypothetical protein